MGKEVSVREAMKKGFTLTEQEIRRIYDIMTSQMKIVIPDGDFDTTITITFKNKIKEEKNNVEDIFAETNGGDWEIQVLDINLHSYKHKAWFKSM